VEAETALKSVEQIFDIIYAVHSHVMHWLSLGWNEERQREHDLTCTDPNCILREAEPD
jgi:hypothetical protein